MADPRFSSLDDYYSSLEAPKGETLRAVVDLILAEFPELEVKLAWNVPQVHRGKDYVAGVSASKKHLSFSPWSEAVIADFRPRLSDLGVTAHTIQLPVDWDIDAELVKDLVRARLAELDAE